VGRAETYSSNLFKRREEYARTPTSIQTKHFDPKSALKNSRSHSQIETISRSALTDNNNVLKSGKKLND
jgi:hypothetical protein